MFFCKFEVRPPSVLQVKYFFYHIDAYTYILFRVKGVNTTYQGDNNILKCHYLNGLCYARYDSDPLAPLKVYTTNFIIIADKINLL